MIKDLKFTPSWSIQKCRFTVSLVCVSSGLPRSGCQDDMRCAGHLGRTPEKDEGEPAQDAESGFGPRYRSEG